MILYQTFSSLLDGDAQVNDLYSTICYVSRQSYLDAHKATGRDSILARLRRPDPNIRRSARTTCRRNAASTPWSRDSSSRAASSRHHAWSVQFVTECLILPEMRDRSEVGPASGPTPPARSTDILVSIQYQLMTSNGHRTMAPGAPGLLA
jgi:hypothetical protein